MKLSKKKFVPEFGEKIKMLNPDLDIHYIKRIIDLNEQIKAYLDYVENRKNMIESACKNALQETYSWSLKDDHPDQYDEKYFSTYINAIASNIKINDYKI